MSEASDESNNKGFRINAKGISCIPCRCKRQFYHKETKTTKENNVITTNTLIDKRNTKCGAGRHTSPDDIFKADTNLQTGSVEICDTGWGKSQITPEELEERVDKIETDIDLIKKDIEDINKYKFKID